MKFISCVFFLLTVFCSAVLGQNDQFIIKGKTHQKEGTVMLYNLKNGITQSVDTTVIESGLFSFRGKENADNFSLIVLKNSNGRQEIECILEKGTIVVDFDSARVTGTLLNDLYTQYRDSVKYYVKVIKENLKSENETPNGVVVRRGSALDSAYYNSGYYTLNFKKKNINNVVGREMFLREINSNFGELAYFDGGEERRFYEIYDLCDEDLKSNSRVVEKKKQIEKDTQRRSKIEDLIGSRYKDFTLLDQNGKKRKISDYVKKYDLLYLDFWASWCGPCLRGMPALKEVFNKYKNKGFHILSISLDMNEADWKKAIEKHDIFWDNVSDLKGPYSELTNAYCVEGIPCGILLDKDGNILEYIAVKENLESVIWKQLNNK